MYLSDSPSTLIVLFMNNPCLILQLLKIPSTDEYLESIKSEIDAIGSRSPI